MESTPSLMNPQDLVPSEQDGARSLDRSLKLVVAFLLLGWIVALASVIAYFLQIAAPVIYIPAVELPALSMPGGEIPAIRFGGVEISIWLIVAAVALILPLFTALVWRMQAARRDVYRTSAGCPTCSDHDFVRIRRRRLERLVSGLALLHTQRNYCRTCSWEGLLVGSAEPRASAFPTLPAKEIRKKPEPIPFQKRPSTQQAAGVPDSSSDAMPISTTDTSTVTAPASEHDSGAEREEAVQTPQPMDFSKSIEPGAPRAIVTAPFGLRVRSAPRNEAEVLLVLPADTIVQLVGLDDDDGLTAWQKVKAGDVTGWVSPAFLRRLNGKGSAVVP